KITEIELVKVPNPKELKNYLDSYIIGQNHGKKVMSVGVYNHYMRINDRAKRLHLLHLKEKEKFNSQHELRPLESRGGIPSEIQQSNFAVPQVSINELNYDQDLQEEIPEIEKSNILMLGPSGSGKTLIAKTLSKILDIPFVITDCTSLTQAGYIGDDVESSIEKLLINSSYDLKKAEKGIIVLDEFDKLSRKEVSRGTKDVGGEGVQQALLKLVEGSTVTVNVKKPVSDKDKSCSSLGKSPLSPDKANETYMVDTSNILFILMGAFVGLDKFVAKRFQNSGSDDNASIISELYENSGKETQLQQVELRNGKKVNALELVTPDDLVKYGIVPELVGRIPIITSLDPLTKKDLLRILTEPKNSLLKQYEYKFKMFGVKLAITSKALEAIAELAMKNGTGARGLRGIMEKLLLDINYESPDSGIKYVLINNQAILDFIADENSGYRGSFSPEYYSRGQIYQFLDKIKGED
ncbi:Mcx1p, partial [Ascoidea rubescens DSM 1968]